MTRRINATIFALSVVAIIVAFATSGESVSAPFRNTDLAPWLVSLGHSNIIAFNLAIGYLASAFFWFLVVYLPEKTRRNLLRVNLTRSYRGFKESTIQILLWASIGIHDSELPRDLCDHKKFKDFFSANKSEQWYAALNGLEDDQERMHELILELEVLADEVGYVLNVVDIQDAKVYQTFKMLKQHIYRLNHSNTYTSDQVKYVGRFLWEILAHWDPIDGYQKGDFLQDAIASL